MNTDTSDEAFREYRASADRSFTEFNHSLTWREAVARCEAQMEERERKAFEAGAFELAKDELPVGYVGPCPMWLGAAYRAFKEGQK